VRQAFLPVTVWYIWAAKWICSETDNLPHLVPLWTIFNRHWIDLKYRSKNKKNLKAIVASTKESIVVRPFQEGPSAKADQ
jgi:hypothetical protein